MLAPFGWLYGKIADVRNSLYDKGVFVSHSLGAKTISIGNITVGGTGKTPLVAVVAEMLAGNGEKVCILTRGYGRENPKSRVLVSDGDMILADVKQSGDEPLELAQKLLGKAMVIADADRVSAAKWAREKFGVTAFVLDDGFQHRRAKRDLDIVCVDATNPFGNGKMLPAGILREPMENLGRADAVVVTRADMAENIAELGLQISKLNPDSPVFLSENRISGLRALEYFHAEPQRTPSKKEEERILAFCALGNPGNFFEQLRQDGFEIAKTKPFLDHHFYTQEDIDVLEKQAAECKVAAFATTAKDAVKLKDLKFEIPCYVVMIEPAIDDEKTFRELINAS